MFRAHRFFCFFLVLGLFLSGCAAQQSGDSRSRRDNLAGLSGKVNPEAEVAFTQARVLWKRALSSVSAVERCTDPEKAIALLDKALSLEANYAEAYIRRGLAKSELGQREEAFNDVTAGLRMKPTAEAYAYRALVSVRARQVRAAQRDLEYSLQKDGKQHLAYNIQGVLELMLDNKPAACVQFRRGCSNGDCSFMDAAKKESICL